jgi:hypothetical protein
MNRADGMAESALNAAVSRVDPLNWLAECLVDPDGSVEVTQYPLEVLSFPEQRQILCCQPVVVCMIEQGSVIERWPDIDTESIAAQQRGF